MGVEFKVRAAIGAPLPIQDELEMHEKLFRFHLSAFNRAIEHAKQDEQLQLAANHAAIITALKGMMA
jgi:hypothetical protein